MQRRSQNKSFMRIYNTTMVSNIKLSHSQICFTSTFNIPSSLRCIMATAGGSVFRGRAAIFSSGYLLHGFEMGGELAVVEGPAAAGLVVDTLAALVALILAASLVELLTVVTPFTISMSFMLVTDVLDCCGGDGKIKY